MKTDEQKKPAEVPVGHEKIEKAAGVLIHYFQALGSRSGMVLNGNQSAELADILQLTVDAAVARSVEESAAHARKMIDAALEQMAAKVAKGGTK